MLLIWLERYGIHFGTTKHANVTVTNIIHIGRISSSAAEDSHIRWDWKRRFFSFFFFFLFRSKEATAILHVFWVYAKRFLQQHSFGAAMANIIKCPANTLPPPRARINKHTYKKKKQKKRLSLFLRPRSFFPLLFLPGYHSVAAHEGGRERIDLPKWAAISQGESAQRFCPWMGIAHFTWPPCL